MPQVLSPTTRSHTTPQEKKGNFFSRHLGRRRKSSVSLPNGHPISPPQQQSSARKASVTSSNPDAEQDYPRMGIVHSPTSDLEQHESRSTLGSRGTDTELSWSNMQSPESDDGTLPRDSKLPSENPSLSPPGSPQAVKSGVRWAPGFSDDVQTRVRRTSSTGTSGTRRESIYVKDKHGRHLEGVDAGVGSKARRLSVAVGRLEVNECLLSEHFSILQRANKKEIGEGGAAIVLLMTSKSAATSGNDKIFAVKEFRERDQAEEDEFDYIRKIKSEYAIAKSLSHPNIVETYRLCTADHERRWMHVMQYCEAGDLNDLITSGCFARSEDRNCIFKQLIRGIDYLHQCGIAHRDIKSENLLVTKDGCLKIADFGTAEVFCGPHPGERNCRRPSLIGESASIKFCSPGLVGSRPYMAPEIIDHKVPYDPRAVDVWSCAIVYVSLVTGGTPWECAHEDVNNYRIYFKSWRDWLEEYPDGELLDSRGLPSFAYTKQWRLFDDLPTRRLLLGMLHPDPAKRWSAKKALETKTITMADCCQQAGYSDDIRTRQRKAMHNHLPDKKAKKGKLAGK